MIYNVCIVGAGISGVDLAVKCVKENISNVLLVDMDENAGGVWAKHRSELCGFDWVTDTPGYRIHEHNTFSAMDLFTNSTADNNFKCINEVLFQHNVPFKCNTKITSFTWLDDKQAWKLIVEGGEPIFTKWVAQCVGFVNSPHMIELPKYYENVKCVHSSQFHITQSLPKESANRVMVIGNSESGLWLVTKLVNSTRCTKVHMGSKSKFNRLYLPAPETPYLLRCFLLQPFFIMLDALNYVTLLYCGINILLMIKTVGNHIAVGFVANFLIGKNRWILQKLSSLFRPTIFKKVKPKLSFDTLQSWRPSFIQHETYKALKSDKLEVCDILSEPLPNVDLIVTATGFKCKMMPIFVKGEEHNITPWDLYSFYESTFSPKFPNMCFNMSHALHTDSEVDEKNAQLVRIISWHLCENKVGTVSKPYTDMFEKIDARSNGNIHNLIGLFKKMPPWFTKSPNISLSKFL